MEIPTGDYMHPLTSKDLGALRPLLTAKSDVYLQIHKLVPRSHYDTLKSFWGISRVSKGYQRSIDESSLDP